MVDFVVNLQRWDRGVGWVFFFLIPYINHFLKEIRKTFFWNLMFFKVLVYSGKRFSEVTPEFQKTFFQN